jgi:hypothetical protein
MITPLPPLGQMDAAVEAVEALTRCGDAEAAEAGR